MFIDKVNIYILFENYILCIVVMVFFIKLIINIINKLKLL